MKASEIINEFCTELETYGFDKPLSIKVSEKVAENLKSELKMMLKYTTITGFAHNECIYRGILIVAPRNFYFGLNEKED